MDREQAEAIVATRLQAMKLDGGDEAVVLLEETMEEPFGWVFFYQSRRYLETGKFEHRFAGNAPFIVDRDSGELFTTGTAKPIAEYIAEYAARRGRHA